MLNGKQIGVFGEVHPQVLENWAITVPCVAGEIDIEELMPKPTVVGKTSEAKKESDKVGTESANNVENPADYFNSHIELKVAKILSVECNPKGDKLYIEHLDDGSGTERIIQSGLRPYLTEDELIGKHVIIAANLAPRKMKGVESFGMLLACDYTEDGKEKVELLTAPWAAPGTQVVLAGTSACEKPAKIDIDKFCKVEYKVVNHVATAAGKSLMADGKEIMTEKADNCEIC